MKKTSLLLPSLLALALFSACVPKAKYDLLLKEKQTLETALQTLKSTPNENPCAAVERQLESLKQQHKEITERTEMVTQSAAQKVADLEKKLKAAEEEIKRLKNN